MRCFEGEAKPHEPFWRFRDAVEQEGDEPEMELYGYISEYSWFEDDVTPKKFRDDLNRYGAGGPITIRMNSYGGDVIAASLISTMIRDYPGHVTVQIDGIAASAATVVAVAGDTVRIQDTAYFMIHDPMIVFMMAALNITDLEQLGQSLKAVKEGILNAYENKSGLSRSRLDKLMADETWMDARRAYDLGFVDEIITKNGVESVQLPEGAAVVNALRNFVNVPEALTRRLVVQPEQDVPAEPDEPVAAEPPVVARLRAEIQILKEKNYGTEAIA